MKLILTDVDDTILQFADPFQDWCVARGLNTIGRLREMYDLVALLGQSDDNYQGLLSEFGEGPGSDLPPETCAIEVLPRLYAEGYRFVAITACGVDESFRLRRIGNLEKVFGFKFEDVHTVSVQTPKTQFLKYYPSAIWVEDNLQHAAEGAALGHQTYLISRKYNSAGAPGLTVVKDWHDIYKDLKRD